MKGSCSVFSVRQVQVKVPVDEIVLVDGVSLVCQV